MYSSLKVCVESSHVLRIVREYSWSLYSVCSDRLGLVWCVVLDCLLLLKTGITYNDLMVLQGITIEKRITFIDVLKRRKPIIFIVNFPFIIS
jgi:hypothetical protein